MAASRTTAPRRSLAPTSAASSWFCAVSGRGRRAIARRAARRRQLRRQPRPSPRAVQSAGEGVGARARGPERRRGGGRRSSSSCIAGDMADLKEQRRSVEVTGGGVGVCGGTHTRGLAPAHGRYTRPARETGQQPHHQFDRTTPNLGIRIIFHKRIE